tara:strand:+ start:409 stop:693 length:285 start_codon:yes stop_codon:yes gene_type:complete
MCGVASVKDIAFPSSIIFFPSPVRADEIGIISALLHAFLFGATSTLAGVVFVANLIVLIIRGFSTPCQWATTLGVVLVANIVQLVYVVSIRMWL